jgi:hypothetical protein
MTMGRQKSDDGGKKEQKIKDGQKRNLIAKSGLEI